MENVVNLKPVLNQTDVHLRREAKARGIITVYMSLILCLMLSLLSAGITSVQVAAARVQVLDSVDIGLYSLFAQYDRALLDKYDLFAIDASGHDGKLDLGRLYDEFNQYMRPILAQNHQHLILLQSGLSGFCLLTDEEGEIFFRQVVQFMRQTAAAQAILTIQSRLDELRQATTEAQEVGRRVQDQGTMDNYDTEIGEAARRSQEQEEAMARAAAGTVQGSSFSGGGGQARPMSQEEVVNPIPVIRRIQQMGLLALVFPASKAISAESIPPGELLSRRSRQHGIGLEGWYNRENGLSADPLFLHYLVTRLGCLTQPASAGLRYQLEYLIGKRPNDADNLEAVAGKLLLIREGVNAASLTADSEKMSQAIQLSSVIAASFRVTPAPVVILAALIVCWSFAESVLDVRTLLEGGKVPLVKTPENWQISLENLPNLLSRLDSDRISDSSGLSYEDYLQILLLSENRHSKAMGALDMIEMNLRKEYGWDGFCLDSCVVAAGAGADVMVGSKKLLSADRVFGYD